MLSSRTIPFNVDRIDRFEKLAGPLRLAKKYQITALYDQLLSFLEADWPWQEDAWQQLRKRTVDDEISMLLLGNPSVDEITRASYDFATIFADPGASCLCTNLLVKDLLLLLAAPVFVLARSFKLCNILPAAFYDLQMWYPSGEAQGHRAYGKLAPLKPLRVSEDCLSREDFQEFMKMKARFDEAVHACVLALRTITERWVCKSSRRTANTTCGDVVGVELKDKWTLKLGDQRFVVPRTPIETLESFEYDCSNEGA